MPTGHPPIGGHGLAGGAPGLDVVDLAVFGGFVAQLAEALPVVHLHRPADGAPSSFPQAGLGVSELEEPLE